MRVSRQALCAFAFVMLAGGFTAGWWELSSSGWTIWNDTDGHSKFPMLHHLPSASLPPAVCSVTPLTEVTAPEALAFESGNSMSDAVDMSGLKPHTVKALNKFETMVTKMGGSFRVTSAYRPSAYQVHLREVWEKWMNELRENRETACETLRADVGHEFTRHGLLETQRPAASSDHTKGTGFDAKVAIPADAKIRRRKLTLDKLARICGLMRPNPSGDRVHFRFRS